MLSLAPSRLLHRGHKGLRANTLHTIFKIALHSELKALLSNPSLYFGFSVRYSVYQKLWHLDDCFSSSPQNASPLDYGQHTTQELGAIQSFLQPHLQLNAPSRLHTRRHTRLQATSERHQHKLEDRPCSPRASFSTVLAAWEAATSHTHVRNSCCAAFNSAWCVTASWTRAMISQSLSLCRL